MDEVITEIVKTANRLAERQLEWWQATDLVVVRPSIGIVVRDNVLSAFGRASILVRFVGEALNKRDADGAFKSLYKAYKAESNNGYAADVGRLGKFILDWAADHCTDDDGDPRTYLDIDLRQALELIATGSTQDGGSRLQLLHGDNGDERREMNKLTKTAPCRIFLQISDDKLDYGEPFPGLYYREDITWCSDSVVRCEVEYIRADLVRAAMPNNWEDDPDAQELAKVLGLDREFWRKYGNTSDDR